MEKSPHISQEELEKIERFWRKEFIGSADEVELNELYANNTLWREKADWVRLTSVAIQECGWEERIRLYQQELKPTQKSSRTKWLQWSVAASIIGAIVWTVHLYYSGTTEQRLFTQYYRPDVGLPTLMGVSENFTFENAMIAYKMEDYDQALDGWQPLLDNNTENDTLLYFIGSAYLAKGNTERAIANFEKVIALPQSAFVSDSYWFLALALLKEQRTEEAKHMLIKTDHDKKEQLLNELTD